jgi:hypothetical protein
MVIKVAHQLAKSGRRENPMNAENESASKWWRVSFKALRRDLTLRALQNLGLYRNVIANQKTISHFYSK